MLCGNLKFMLISRRRGQNMTNEQLKKANKVVFPVMTVIMGYLSLQ